MHDTLDPAQSPEQEQASEAEAPAPTTTARIISAAPGAIPVVKLPESGPRTIVGVRLTSLGPIVDCDGSAELKMYETVLLRYPDGIRVGRVLRLARQLETRASMPRVLRVASVEDKAAIRRNEQMAFEMVVQARQLVREMRLDIRIGAGEMYFDGSRIVLYFGSEGRVDFRDLLHRLQRSAPRRIEMRQIGLRDLAGQSGGVGVCGQELCCSSWLKEFDPVSIRSAKTQCLSMSGDKLTGQCGKLKCCLNFENETYEKLREGLPMPGKWFRFAGGYAKVRDLDIIRQKIYAVALDGAPHQILDLARSDILEVFKTPPKDLLQTLNERGRLRSQGLAPQPKQNTSVVARAKGAMEASDQQAPETEAPDDDFMHAPDFYHADEEDDSSNETPRERVMMDDQGPAEPNLPQGSGQRQGEGGRRRGRGGRGRGGPGGGGGGGGGRDRQHRG